MEAAEMSRSFEKLSRFYTRTKNARVTRSFSSLGRKTVRELDHNSRQAVILQHRLLMELLSENKNTTYGQICGFGKIRNASEYRSQVPFTTYDDYEPYIRKMMDGQQNLLSALPPVHFALTSGSIGVPKYIPVSERELKKYRKYSLEMPFGVAEEYYRNTTGRGVPAGPGLSAIEMKVVKTGSGAVQGNVSGMLMNTVKDYAADLLSSPWEVVNWSSGSDMKYLKARLALERRDLAFMGSVFLTGLVDLMDYIRDHYEMLCRDIYHGRIDRNVKVSDEIRTTLTGMLRPDPARARQLLLEFRDGFDTPVIPRIWPRMSWIGGIGTGGFSPYARKMHNYSGKGIPYNNVCYAASESFMAVARHMGDDAFVLVPDGGFYEFIPVRGGDQTKTLTIEELEVGEDYEIIVTNLSGFYRYRLQDVVRVTGYYNETPMVRFLYRKDQLISMNGEKMNEEALSWAMDHFSLETSVHVIDYSVYADDSTSPGHDIAFCAKMRFPAVRKCWSGC